MIVKHANPCGVAVAGSIEEAYARALGVRSGVGVRRGGRPQPARVGATLAERIAGQFVEVLFAPGYEDGALDVLRGKEAVRVLDSAERRRHRPASATTAAWSAACSPRTATTTSRTARG